MYLTKQIIYGPHIEDAIEVMTTNALSGNGILTNRKVPSAEDIKGIFNVKQIY